jgi:hypothetical protein
LTGAAIGRATTGAGFATGFSTDFATGFATGFAGGLATGFGAGLAVGFAFAAGFAALATGYGAGFFAAVVAGLAAGFFARGLGAGRAAVFGRALAAGLVLLAGLLAAVRRAEATCFGCAAGRAFLAGAAGFFAAGFFAAAGLREPEVRADVFIKRNSLLAGRPRTGAGRPERSVLAWAAPPRAIRSMANQGTTRSQPECALAGSIGSRRSNKRRIVPYV